MKCTLLVALLLMSVPAVAEDNQPKEPNALVKARIVYREELKAAVDPITEKYLRVLDKMMKEFGSQGDLDPALAVRCEIKAITPTKDSDPTKSTPAPSIIGKWTWCNGETTDFEANGIAYNSSGKVPKWRCLDKDRLRYEVVWPSGTIDFIQMSVDGLAMVVKNNTGGTWTHHRLP